ncbi:2-aminoethylphosphonate--pyruvate transaminase [Roseomonas haemaphysalidis]|uniref:2-aminoethylphosphonate--pyruvate transaminase n=1 Tax=Roseomonas haemaphysalidis TaxID=2768162 RepID=A0ABS3KN76_9PROT|nr:2-aminoethylphosphonate--pyruvate transaminase [Roseomonas haemaphysalidis]MBO1078455.1 2-aminoethylphosphonate--pyruvate transaminase [Roseomonas haemaphysalidis]
MPRHPNQPLLLTPGPVSVSRTTREAMMTDRPAGDVEFQEDLSFARRYLVSLVGGGEAYTAIPLPGSATYANEGVIASLVPDGGKLLLHSNGVYGDRLVEICTHLRVEHSVVRTPPFTPPSAELFEQMLRADPGITHVMLVHCETSTGVLNPLEGVAALCRAYSKGLLVDAVASFGAIPLDARRLGFQAVTLSSNKCMQGVPGVGWAVVHRQALENAKGQCRSLALDLWDHNQHMDRTGGFRFTPPTHVVAAFAQACREHAAEGGAHARLARYSGNWQRLVDGMRQMGFTAVVPDRFASPIVATFREPTHPAFSFQALFDGMKQRGFIIFPGRLALADTFRIGCMGDVTEHDIGEALQAVAETLAAMGVTQFGRDEVALIDRQ